MHYLQPRVSLPRAVLPRFPIAQTWCAYIKPVRWTLGRIEASFEDHACLSLSSPSWSRSPGSPTGDQPTILLGEFSFDAHINKNWEQQSSLMILFSSLHLLLICSLFAITLSVTNPPPTEQGNYFCNTPSVTGTERLCVCWRGCVQHGWARGLRGWTWMVSVI